MKDDGLIPFECMEGYALCESPRNQVTDGGIALPDQETPSDNEPVLMRVVAIGPGEWVDGKRREVPLEVGGWYYWNFPQYALTNKITLNRKRYVLCQAKFVCGKEF